jgi:CubicO group peptidase (beta-lactamase class C family)
MIEPEYVGMSSERLTRIRPTMEKHIGDDKMAGAVTLIARRGKVVHLECVGLMDRERNAPMQTDTIFRIYSMTKPIICVALMTLYEQGHFHLFDPASEFIPAFADLKVYVGETNSGIQLADLEREVTIHDLLTHTSGMTYHIFEYGAVEEMCREVGVSSDKPLADFVDDLLQLPLTFQPGAGWRYSFSHDVVAYLIEIISGKPLDVFLRENLLEPLGMVDTGYHVPENELDRFAAMYGSGDFIEPDMTITKWYGDAEDGVNRLISSPTGCLESAPHQVFRGGVGLVSTAPDYLRFCQMLLNNGELDGERVLSRKTVELMTANHLAREFLPYEIGGIYYPGYGYGLGLHVLLDVGQSASLGTVGEFGWSGAASTDFWIDPQEELIGIQMAQFQPSGYHLIAPDFRVLTYQAIVD